MTFWTAQSSGSSPATPTASGTVHGNTESFSSTGLGLNSLLVNESGWYNIAIGEEAMKANTTGDTNIAVGYSGLRFNTSGYANIGIGYTALYSNTTANANVAIGFESGYSLTTGHNNTLVGTSTMPWGSTGIQNTCLGSTAGENNTGSNNTLVGYRAGVSLSSGSGNTIIGANATGVTSTLTNNVIIANGTGAVKAQNDDKNWVFTGACNTLRAGSFATAGDSQLSTYHLRRVTTDTTGSYLTGDGTSESSTNIPVLKDNSIWIINAYIVAKDVATNAGASWYIRGVAKRGTGAATVVAISEPTMTMLYDAGISGWNVMLTANTTIGGLSVVVNGEAGKTVRWTCRLETVEVA